MAFRLEGRIQRVPSWLEWDDDGRVRADSAQTLVLINDAFNAHRNESVGRVPNQHIGVDQRFEPIPAYLILKTLFGRAEVKESGEVPILTVPEGAIA